MSDFKRHGAKTTESYREQAGEGGKCRRGELNPRGGAKVEIKRRTAR